MATLKNNNVGNIISTKNSAIPRALEQIGILAEKYAKALCPVGTSESTGIQGYRGGTLRNSITHQTDKDSVTIGSNVVYAPFVELGTGPYFNTPPQWEQFSEYHGTGTGHGYVRPRPYLRPAIEDHLDEYKRVIEDELQ